jgi:hypothetical protein
MAVNKLELWAIGLATVAGSAFSSCSKSSDNNVNPVTPPPVVVVTPPVDDKPPIVIGSTDMLGNFVKNADGSYTIKTLSFSNLSTGKGGQIGEGTGAKIQYHNGGGKLSLLAAEGGIFMVESNPYKNDDGLATAVSDTTGVGSYEISGLDENVWGAKTLFVIPVKTQGKLSAFMTVNSGITEAEISSITSDQLMGVAKPKSVALLALTK